MEGNSSVAAGGRNITSTAVGGSGGGVLMLSGKERRNLFFAVVEVLPHLEVSVTGRQSRSCCWHQSF